MTVGLYVRVSTEEQAKEGHSISAQTKKLIQYAELNEYEYKLYNDEGYSAKDLNRPAASELFNDIKNSKLKAVIIYKLDRLTRNVQNLYEIMEVLDQHKCSLISVTESLDTSSASGRFFITMLGAMAQWERETIGERTFFGMKEAIIKGAVAGRAPFGYIKTDEGFEIDEAAATIVRKIFELYAQGYGTLTISNAINDDTNSTSWNPTKIIRTITNRTYIGEWIMEFRDGSKHTNSTSFEPIISEELFNEVANLYDKRSRLHPKTNASNRIFANVLTCSYCGDNIIGQSNFIESADEEQLKKLRYRCKLATQQKCKAGGFNEIELEERFVEYMTDFIHDISSDKITSLTNTTQTNKSKLYKELSKIKNIKQKNHVAFENDLISLDDYKNRIHELNQREQDITQQLNNTPELPRIMHLEKQNFKQLWSLLERVDKKKFILTYIKSITVEKAPRGETRSKLKILNIDFV